jgi:hypothetical protein
VTDEVDREIENYRVALIKEDADLYNRYLGVVNKKVNDQLELEKKAEEEAKISAGEDISDIKRKVLEEKMDVYDVMVLEFEPEGDKIEHVVTGGKQNVGKVTEKQNWSELH